jgi:hypothetical protein
MQVRVVRLLKTSFHPRWFPIFFGDNKSRRLNIPLELSKCAHNDTNWAQAGFSERIKEA